MNKLITDLEMLRHIDTMRPKDFKVTLIAPNGALTHSPKFATKAKRNSGPRSTLTLARMLS